MTDKFKRGHLSLISLIYFASHLHTSCVAACHGVQEVGFSLREPAGGAHGAAAGCFRPFSRGKPSRCRIGRRLHAALSSHGLVPGRALAAAGHLTNSTGSTLSTCGAPLRSESPCVRISDGIGGYLAGVGWCLRRFCSRTPVSRRLAPPAILRD